MQLISDKPSGLKEGKTAIVEVRLWETFLTHDRHNLYNTLSAYSLDDGPLAKDSEDIFTISFRFMERDWNSTLRDLLAAHNIPVIKETALGKEHSFVMHLS
jgi:hypothetical protein